MNKIPHLFLVAILVLIFEVEAFAAPSISSVSGQIVHGQSITISGSAFGTKPVPGPLVWDNFESGSLGTRIGGNAPTVRNISTSWVWSDGSSNGVVYPVYSNAVVRGVSTKSSLHDFSTITGCALTIPTAQTTYYFTWWYHTVRTGANWPRQTKPFILEGSTGDQMPAAYIGWGQVYPPPDESLRTALIDNSTTLEPTIWFDPSFSAIQGEWIRFEVLLIQSSSNVHNGTFKVWVHTTATPSIAQPVNIGGNALTRVTNNYWNALNIGDYYSHGDATDGGKVYIDDFYLDNAQARVEIGNASTWSSCTRREIQIPSAWSDTSVTITVNQGLFKQGTSAYLYVVDSNGSVNPMGYPISIGVDPRAPAPPSGLKIIN